MLQMLTSSMLLGIPAEAQWEHRTVRRFERAGLVPRFVRTVDSLRVASAQAP
jgi:hypothetical protein